MSRRTKRLSRRVTLKDVAEYLGISTAAVSYAYTRPDRTSVELRKRVLEAAKRMGYSGPNPMARNLRRGRSSALGVVFPDSLPYAFSDPSTALFLEGVASATEAAELGLLLVPGTLRKIRNPKAVHSAAVDGFIVYSMASDDPLLDAIRARPVPAVLVDSGALEGVPGVGIDDEAAAHEAASHLLRMGHRRVGVIGLNFKVGVRSGIARLESLESATYRDVRSRLRGYAKAFREYELKWDESVPLYQCSTNSDNEGRVAARVLLGLRPRLTAILAMSDLLAIGAMAEIESMGLHIPNDVSVVGFDDIPAASTVNPQLTTMYQPHVDKGFWAARILIALVRDEEPPDPGLLPTHLVVRDSAGPPPSAVAP
jgi:DNA-binding LacI/PurR family transcriptional regulator